MPAFVFSERAAEGTAVDQQILPGNVAGMRGAQERAGRTKLVRIAEFPSDSLVSTMDARKGRTLFRQRLPSAEGEAG